MIACDTSSLIAYLEGGAGADVDVVDAALADKVVVLPPVVLSELLSDPGLPAEVAGVLLSLPLMAISDGYWERVGRCRARVLSAGRTARLADSLIAQSCMDHQLPLVTRDRDFRHFADLAGLRLLP